MSAGIRPRPARPLWTIETAPDHIAPGALLAVVKEHRAVLAEKALKVAAFPKAHAMCVPALAILAPCTGLGLKLINDGFDLAKTVADWIIPERIEDHRGGKKLGAGQGALAAWHGAFIDRQPQPA